MAYRTDVLLTCLGVESTEEKREVPFEEQLNEWLRHWCNATLRQTSKYAGGRYKMNSIVYMGIFNYLPMPEFLEFLNTLPWRNRDGVVVFYKSDHDTAWSSVRFTDSGPVVEQQQPIPVPGES